MKETSIQKIAIAGAGTMGAGIATVCARAGYGVILFDISGEMLQKAEKSIRASLQKMHDADKISRQAMEETNANIRYSSDLAELRADLVIEAIIEKPEAKISLFRQLIEINGDKCIYATNTSSIPVTQIAAGVSHPERVVGIHFFNPAQVMKLVEIIKGAKTSEDIVATSVAFVESLHKTPVVAADSPGFIVNRIARPYYVESLKILEENVCSHETIDGLMEACGFKMGPFRLMDLIGVDTNYSVTESQFRLFNNEPRFRPSRIQKQKVDAGLHGKKSGEGFYRYE